MDLQKSKTKIKLTFIIWTKEYICIEKKIDDIYCFSLLKNATGKNKKRENCALYKA